jgi:hypothetical protein
MRTFRTSLICVAAAVFLCGGLAQSFADSAPSLGQASQYALFGWSGSVSLIDVSVTGNYAQVSGVMTFNPAFVTGKADLGTSVLQILTGGSHIDGGTNQPVNLTQAVTDAQNASAAAAALTPTQTFGNITSGLTINGNGGLNVISCTQIAPQLGAALTLQGNANDIFILNVGINGVSLVTGAAISLAGGVTPDHVLVNILGGVLSINQGGVQNGTFIIPSGPATIDRGTVINGAVMAGGVISMKHTIINEVPFIPEPSSAILVAMGIGLLGLVRRRSTSTS